MDQYTGLSQDTKSIHISYNEIVLLHTLCMENRSEMITNPDDPLYELIQRLGMAGPTPESLKENYYFNLRLRDTRRSSVENDVGLTSPTSPVDTKSDVTVLNQITNILKELPSLPASKNSFEFNLLDILNAGCSHAQQKGDAEFVQRIRDAIEVLGRAQTSGYDEEKLLQEIQNNAHKRMKRKQVLEKKIALLDKVSADIAKRREYLQDQLDLYHQYLTNSISKSFAR